MVKRSLVIRLGAGVLGLWTATVLAQPQGGSIRGMVHDKDFDSPLAAPQVMIVETGQTVTGTDEGNYVFPQLAPGTYTLVFTKDGYTRQVKSNVAVTPGQLTEIDVWMSGEFTEMEEFVVQDIQLSMGTEAGLLELRAQAPSLMDSISADLMNKAGAGDAASALRLVSGTTVTEGKFAVIRGLPDRYVNSQLNGVRLPSADDKTRAVELDQYPSAVVESIQISKTFTPDQQGDASGGAVNVILKGIPDQTIFQITSSTSYNTQTTGRSDFLTYKGGGLTYMGFNPSGNRQIQGEWLTPTGGDGLYQGAVGVSRGDAPIDYKYGLTAGTKVELEDGVKVGGLISYNYERDSSMEDDGQDNRYVLNRSTGQLVPQKSLQNNDDYRTSLFDITQGSQEAKWSGLAVAGLETEHHQFKVSYLYTHTAEDTATLAEDTRGNAYFTDHPDSSVSGAVPPFRRNETLDYVERTTQSLQFSGHHAFPVFGDESDWDTYFKPLNPEFDWVFALNQATFFEPDKRLFSTYWAAPQFSITDFTPEQIAMYPDIIRQLTTGTHNPQPPGNNINLGFLQRVFRDISEDSTQYQVNLKFPFKQWTDTKGYVKVGVFNDHTTRTYNQDSFSNFGDTASSYQGDFDQLWSAVFPDEVHNVTQSYYDTDYRGQFNVDACYWMVDLPLSPVFKVVGGMRFENTQIKTEVSPDVFPNGVVGPTYYPPGSQTGVKVTPDAVNVNYKQDDILPAVSFAWDVFKPLTLRGSFARTVARQTFRELTPIQQQEYLGGDVFAGNPTLKMAALRNYDLRLDYKPLEGSLFSVSYFVKKIKDPIEYIQQSTNGQGTFTTAVNYPKGQIKGWELEARQDLGQVWEPLAGLSLGGNATLIDSQVTIPEDEVQHIIDQGGPGRSKRDATNAPALLYNLYLNYLVDVTGTEFSLFYTVRGDTLVAGGDVGDKGYIPDVYETEYGTLNFGVTQKLGEYIKIKFQAKNLLDPQIQSVYRYHGQDTLKTSYTNGIELSLGISAEFKF